MWWTNSMSLSMQKMHNKNAYFFCCCLKEVLQLFGRFPCHQDLWINKDNFIGKLYEGMHIHICRCLCINVYYIHICNHMQRYRRSIDMDLTWTHKDVIRMSFHNLILAIPAVIPWAAKACCYPDAAAGYGATPAQHVMNSDLGPLSLAPPRSNYDDLWLK
jgi:hypothetical protein